MSGDECESIGGRRIRATAISSSPAQRRVPHRGLAASLDGKRERVWVVECVCGGSWVLIIPKVRSVLWGRGPGVGPRALRVTDADALRVLQQLILLSTVLHPQSVCWSHLALGLFPDSFRLKGLASSRSNSYSARSLTRGPSAPLWQPLSTLETCARSTQRSQPNPNSAIVVSSSTHLSSRPANFCLNVPTS
ncbi:hypothetical protein BDV93DRAFT_522753 [Ceratobasidium sp. AG-I]|nr:hypothetical protein BDV93DRAFT_522753 [Ceratobasidium sp. AG-I]